MEQTSDTPTNIIWRTLGHIGGGNGGYTANGKSRDDTSAIDQAKTAICDGVEPTHSSDSEDYGKPNKSPFTTSLGRNAMLIRAPKNGPAWETETTLEETSFERAVLMVPLAFTKPKRC